MASSTIAPGMLMLDTVMVQNLHVKATIGPDRWGKTRPQPIRLSLSLETPLAEAGLSDNIDHTINYGTVFKELSKLIDGKSFESLHALTAAAVELVISKDRAEAVRIVAEAENQFLLAESLGVSLSKDNNGMSSVRSPDHTFIRDLRLSTIIGLNPGERLAKQVVVINITFHTATLGNPDWQKIHADLVKEIESTAFLTLEAFVTHVARIACSIDGADVVTVRAQKPSALVAADSSGVEITRNRAFFAEK